MPISNANKRFSPQFRKSGESQDLSISPIVITDTNGKKMRIFRVLEELVQIEDGFDLSQLIEYDPNESLKDTEAEKEINDSEPTEEKKSSNIEILNVEIIKHATIDGIESLLEAVPLNDSSDDKTADNTMCVEVAELDEDAYIHELITNTPIESVNEVMVVTSQAEGKIAESENVYSNDIQPCQHSDVETHLQQLALPNANAVDNQQPQMGFTQLKYKCSYCKKTFKYEAYLSAHERRHTSEQQTYQCEECGKCFHSSGNLRQHLKRHSFVLNYKCPICPRRFPCQNDLSAHKSQMHEVGKCACEICPKRFAKPYLLKQHMMSHNGERPHKCDFCEKRFTCTSHKSRHMRIHTGEKPYACEYCKQAFGQSNDLIAHLRQHVGENVYKCEICSQAFRLARELRTHFACHTEVHELSGTYRGMPSMPIEYDTSKYRKNTPDLM